MKRFIFYTAIFLALGMSACTGSGSETAVAQTDETAATLTPTAYPTPYPEMPRPDSCPITRQQEPRFVPPKPYAEWGPNGDFWYGSNDLWTLLSPNGTWQNLPKSETGFRNKIFWWRAEFSRGVKTWPELTMTARRLDEKAPEVEVAKASSGYHETMGHFISSAIELPTLGCWEITGQYEDSTLSFVVWVAP